MHRRSSHEERGLKYRLVSPNAPTLPSRSSHEERGLKFDIQITNIMGITRRSSHEERGLKSVDAELRRSHAKSLLA